MGSALGSFPSWVHRERAHQPSPPASGKEVPLEVLGRGVPPADWRGTLGRGQHGRQMDVGELEVRRPIRPVQQFAGEI